jgi:DNA (cytosine-5)-methyltransferase 1
LYWMGHADSARWERAGQTQPSERSADLVTAWSSEARRVADSMLAGRAEGRTKPGRRQIAGGGAVGGMADSDGSRCGEGRPGETGGGGDEAREQLAGLCPTSGMAHPGHLPGCPEQLDEQGQGLRREPGPNDGAGTGECGAACRLANSNGREPSDSELQRGRRLVQLAQDPLDGFWRDADWLLCTDGKARPVEPGTQPLASGATKRLGRLRGYGNALCAPQAQAFVEAVMGCLP